MYISYSVRVPRTSDWILVHIRTYTEYIMCKCYLLKQTLESITRAYFRKGKCAPPINCSRACAMRPSRPIDVINLQFSIQLLQPHGLPLWLPLKNWNDLIGRLKFPSLTCLCQGRVKLSLDRWRNHAILHAAWPDLNRTKGKLQFPFLLMSLCKYSRTSNLLDEVT